MILESLETLELIPGEAYMDIETPECDKILANQPKTQVLSDFVDWLNSNKYAICTLETRPECYPIKQWEPIRASYEQLFAEYIGIDLKKAEEERRAILDFIRKQHDS